MRSMTRGDRRFPCWPAASFSRWRAATRIAAWRESRALLREPGPGHAHPFGPAELRDADGTTESESRRSSRGVRLRQPLRGCGFRGAGPCGPGLRNRNRHRGHPLGPHRRTAAEGAGYAQDGRSHGGWRNRNRAFIVWRFRVAGGSLPRKPHLRQETCLFRVRCGESGRVRNNLLSERHCRNGAPSATAGTSGTTGPDRATGAAPRSARPSPWIRAARTALPGSWPRHSRRERPPPERVRCR